MNERERKSLGLRVTQTRTARGWSKEGLADKAGITTTTLRRIEEGLRVQDAKLELVLQQLGLSSSDSGQDVLFEEQIHPGVFMLPPEIERGYEETVRFTKAIAKNVPELQSRATRLMVQAAELFADSANAMLDADASKDDFDLAAHDEEHSIESEQGHDETP